jgi:hypothetical protein
MAVFQSACLQHVPASSRASHAPTGSARCRDYPYAIKLWERAVACPRLSSSCETLWERACSRWRQHSQYLHCWPTAFASRLAPTLELWRAHDCRHPAKPCGSGLAREEASTANISFADPPLSRAGSLPPWSCGVPTIVVILRNPVGAGLPAKRPAQPISLLLTHRFREQARSYLGAVACARLSSSCETLWERACPRRGPRGQYLHG